MTFYVAILSYLFFHVLTVSHQLQAKFDLSNGPSYPSKATATFECEDASLSGLSLDLQGSAYKVDVFTERCVAG